MMATQSCSYFRKSEFTILSAVDLSTYIQSMLPDSQLRTVAQNEGQRKKFIQTFKRAFSLAQAAEAEGLTKGNKFSVQMGLTTDQLLANEFSKRNKEVTVAKEETDAYYAAHKDTFESDLKVITEGQKQFQAPNRFSKAS